MENKEETLHELFDVGILLKGIHALVEVLGGIFAFLISPDFVLKVITRITQSELSEDPKDLFSNYVLNWARSFSPDTKQFFAAYLLFHGIINLVLVIGLFKEKIWAYYVSFFVLTIFVFYQIYRYIYHPSVFMIILTFFDLVVIWLVWKEFKRLEK